MAATPQFYEADVADAEELSRAIEVTAERFGSLDILVNNAGIHFPGGFEDMAVEAWDRVIAVNLRAAYIAIRTAVPHLKRSTGGRIIQIGSIHGYGGGLGPAYPATKAGVTNMVRDAAVELGRYGITANTIWPGYIETAIQDYLTQEDIAAYQDSVHTSTAGSTKRHSPSGRIPGIGRRGVDYRRNPCRGWRTPGADLIACPGGMVLKICDYIGLNGMFSGSTRVHLPASFRAIVTVWSGPNAGVFTARDNVYMPYNSR